LELLPRFWKGELDFFSKKKIGNEITYKDVEMYETSTYKTLMYLAEKIFLHLPIMFNNTNFVSLASQDYMIGTGYLD